MTPKLIDKNVKKGLPDGVHPGPVSSAFGYPHQSTLAWGIPLSGRRINADIMFAFHDMLPPMNYNTVMFKTKGWPIDRARNYFVEEAKKINAKYLFFWDEDVIPPPQALRELIFMAEHHDDAAVIGAIYCLKVDRPEPLIFNGTGTGPFWDWRVGEIFPVQAIGMGCTLIRMEALNDLKEPYFQTVDDMSAYLDNVRFGEQWTEDLYFCKKMIDTKKWKILAHGQLICDHVDLSTGKVYNLPTESKPMRPITAQRGKKIILDIGSGDQPYRTNEGRVITVDIREDTNPDYCCDFRRLPFATNEFDIVHSAHCLEHVSRNEVETVLDEWIRVLKFKGELRLNIPNLKWAAKKILAAKGQLDNDTMNVLYGQQEHPKNYHFSGFTPDSLSDLLKKRGFVNQAVREQGYHILISAWRYPLAPKKKKAVVKKKVLKSAKSAGKKTAQAGSR